MEECRFVDRISEFVEYYSVINTGGIFFNIIYKKNRKRGC